MSLPLISVVVPCFNGANFLQPCIQSALQANGDVEIIIVDDGSTDQSLQRARELAQAHPDRMMIVAQSNRGPAAARNAGIRAAAGKYLAFLDVDDEFAPGFLADAANVLEVQPAIAAVQGRIEFVDLHRPVQPWQREVMEFTMPGNILLRTETARQIGGFPVDPAFRGPAAGEDGCFREQLALFGSIAKLDRIAVRYRVHKASHFDFFLDRAVFENGSIAFNQSSTEELDGTFSAAIRRYKEDVALRMMARLGDLVQTETTAGANFDAYQRAFNHVPGSIEPLEAFCLYTLAKRWPVRGWAVEIAGTGARSTSWLAVGSKASGCGKVAAIAPTTFALPNPPAPLSPDSGHPALSLRHTLEQLRLGDLVQVFEGDPLHLCTQWRDRIRLLLLNCTSADITQSHFQAWSPLLAKHGLLILHGDPAHPPAKRLHDHLQRDAAQWNRQLTIRHLAVFRKTH